MGLEDGSDNFDWGSLPQSGGDPLAGSSWTDVQGDGSLPSNGFLQDAPLPEGLDSFSSGGNALQEFLKRLRAGGSGSNPLKDPHNLADLGSTLGAFSAGQKADRFMKGNFTQNYDRLMLDAQKDRNSNESDALQKLAQTSYIMGGGSKYKPQPMVLNGKTYAAHDSGYGPVPVTQAEKDGAAALQGQLGGRLAPGGSYTPQPLGDYANPSTAEKIGSYGATGVSGLGSIMNMLSQGGNGASGGDSPDGQSGVSGVGSTLQGISKAAGTAGTFAKLASLFSHGGAGASTASAAGAGTGTASSLGSTLGTIGKVAGPVAGAALGTYGLAKNNSVGSDVMSGMGAGASIGSFAGPIGTGVGAGVGALVGALRGAFSVTGKEQSGRDAQAQITQNLSKLATPQQIADSKKSGWPDPNQALSLIVMRDKLTQSGMPGPQAEAQAESIMKGMWNGEKHGTSAVNQAFTPFATGALRG